MANRGEFKYDEEMTACVSIRMTSTQVQSLSAMSHAMSLTIGDTVRFAVDNLLEDVPEPALFAPYVRVAFWQYNLEKPRK